MPTPAERGYSLIELIMGMVVIGTAIALLLSAVNPNRIASVRPILRMKTAQLGQAYLEEILSRRFDESSFIGGAPRCNEAGQPPCTAALGPEGGETRSTFDDVDDYHGLTETPPRDARGIARSGYQNYRVQVSVAYAGGDLGLPAAALKRVSVTITAPDATSNRFAVYRGNF